MGSKLVQLVGNIALAVACGLALPHAADPTSAGHSVHAVAEGKGPTRTSA